MSKRNVDVITKKNIIVNLLNMITKYRKNNLVNTAFDYIIKELDNLLDILYKIEEKGGVKNITNTSLIANSLEKYYIDVEEVRTNCYLCGKRIERGIGYKKILSEKFTNRDLAKAKDSKHICIDCATCIKNTDLVRKNFIATEDKIIFLSKNEIENYLFNIEKFVENKPFVVCLTKTYKKHNSFKAEVNYDTGKYYIQLEDEKIYFDTEKYKEIYEKLNEAYLYFSKEELETGEYNFLSMKEFGLEKTEEYDNYFSKHRGTKYFNFLIWILNSEKRNEIIKQKREEKKLGRN